MNYVRTSGGSMMPISFKNSVLIVNKKQTTKIKPVSKQKKVSLSNSK
jgi:signal peptidase I